MEKLWEMSLSNGSKLPVIVSKNFPECSLVWLTGKKVMLMVGILFLIGKFKCDESKSNWKIFMAFNLEADESM